MALNFERYAQEGNEFIKQVAAASERPEDKDYASRITMMVLRALRSRITVEESLHLISQLPMFLKAVYVDGWKLSEVPKEFDTTEEFLEEIRRQENRPIGSDFSNKEEAIKAIKAVFSVLKANVSTGEINDVKDQLPKEISGLWE